MLRAENALPIANGYIPVPSLVSVGTAGIVGIANDTWVERESQGAVFAFAGDEDALYRVESDLFADRSRAAGYTAMTGSDRWRHERFGDDLFAVNGQNDLQIYNLPAGGVGGLFSDAVLAGTTPPGTLQAKYIGVVRDQLVLAFVSGLDAAEGGTLFPYRVHRSAVGDPLDFIPSLTTLAGFQDIPDLGEIRGLTGGEYGTILLEKGLVRMDFVGPPAVMQYDQIEGSPGCFEPRTVIRVKNQTYWYSPEGWQMFDGQTVNPIGAEKIDRWFLSNACPDDFNLMSVVDAPQINAIIWGFVSADNPGDGKIDAALLYNYDINEWGYARIVGVDCLGTTATVGFTLEQLDTINTSLDALPASLDSRLYKGGAEVSGAVKSGEQFTFTGVAGDAVFETGDVQPVTNGESIIKRLNPAIEGAGTITAQVGKKETFSDSITWSDVAGLNSRGFIPVHGFASRIHRLRSNATGPWTFASGVNVEAKPAGQG
jgi:hypothetical protein